MATNKTKLVGPGIAIAAAFIFLAVVALSFPALTEGMFGKIDKPAEKLTLAQIVVSFFGFIGAISAFSFAIYQYIQSARWKRMEFIAGEIKEFEADPVVQNALMMIDWGRRKINLNLVSTPTEQDFKIITRTAQWKALLPHELKHKYEEYQSKPDDEKSDADEKFAKSETISSEIAPPEDSKKTEDKTPKDYNFTPDEAKIRDTYDVFLTRLDRFETFIEAKLIEPDELKPFIAYWIDALTSGENLNKDAAWKFTLLTYINRYKYTGVIKLFKNYDLEINPKGKDYQAIKNQVQNKTLAERLFKSVSSST
jgi:hypothetical protein